jgi:hypothetical protein
MNKVVNPELWTGDFVLGQWFDNGYTISKYWTSNYSTAQNSQKDLIKINLVERYPCDEVETKITFFTFSK